MTIADDLADAHLYVFNRCKGAERVRASSDRFPSPMLPGGGPKTTDAITCLPAIFTLFSMRTSCAFLAFLFSLFKCCLLSAFCRSVLTLLSTQPSLASLRQDLLPFLTQQQQKLRPLVATGLDGEGELQSGNGRDFESGGLQGAGQENEPGAGTPLPGL